MRVATVKAGSPTISISLAGDDLGVRTANIFARASGYIAKRNVDIGDHVKKGQLLAEITAPELDHQIAAGRSDARPDQGTLRQNRPMPTWPPSPGIAIGRSLTKAG